MPEQQIPTANNIKALNAENTVYAATINGKTWSGISEQSRHWASVQKAIDEGAQVEAYTPPPEPTYKEKREREYPKVGDQLDALWKQLDQDRLDGKDLIQEADDRLNEILAVKDKYPKE